MAEREWGERRGLEENFRNRRVTFPYTLINEELYVGLLGEDDRNLHIPFIFIKPEKTHFQFEEIVEHGILFWRRRESKGLQPYKIESFILEGESMTINAELEGNKGFGVVEAYKLEFSVDVMREVVSDAEYAEDAIYEIDTEELTPVSTEARYLAQCKFYHFSKVLKVSDIVTLAGLARLREEVLPQFEEESE